MGFSATIVVARVEWHAPQTLIPQWNPGVTLYERVEQAPVPTDEHQSQLAAKVSSGHVGALGIDTAAKLDATSAAELRGAGVQFVLRYVSLAAPRPGDLALDEAQEILTAGLALMAVQHVRYPGWIPTEQLGASDGSCAAKNASAAGVVRNTILWCDLEGESGAATPAGTIGYARAWFSAMKSGGYEPGVYVGAGVPLTAEQWYLLPFRRYWKSLSFVPTPMPRDFCMIQLYPTTSISDVGVDFDVIQSDRRGGYPTWMISDNSK